MTQRCGTWRAGAIPVIRLAVIALLAAAVALAAPGCGSRGPRQGGKVKVAWIGLVCEAPIFVAYENGYFAEEGLDVELVKTDWDAMQSGLSFGRYDATHTLITYMLKPIEQGLDAKMTGGVHKGCLRLQAGAKTDIRTVADLRGKRIGVATMGSPPMIFTNRVLTAAGMDAMKDVEWIVFPNAEIELALAKGYVDAVANSEPIGSLLLANKAVRTIADQSVDMPYKDEYCCAVVVSGNLARTDPAAAAKVTRALMKAAKWVGVNPLAAARLSVEKKYLASNAELNATALTQMTYIPSVEACRLGVVGHSLEMKKANMLSRSTDPHELARRAWLALDGVSDEWIQGVAIERIPGGGPVPTDPAFIAAIMKGKKPGTGCCVN